MTTEPETTKAERSALTMVQKAAEGFPMLPIFRGMWPLPKAMVERLTGLGLAARTEGAGAGGLSVTEAGMKLLAEAALAKNHAVSCETCAAKPTVGDTGLCGPCCFGEAATAGGRW